MISYLTYITQKCDSQLLTRWAITGTGSWYPVVSFTDAYKKSPAWHLVTQGTKSLCMMAHLPGVLITFEFQIPSQIQTCIAVIFINLTCLIMYNFVFVWYILNMYI